MTTETARIIEFDVPLPPRACSSNGDKGSWRKKDEGTKAYRRYATILTQVAIAGTDGPKPARVRLHLAFCLKGGRKELYYNYQPRDVDNAIAAFKAAKDGIADALGIPDSARYMELGAVTLTSKDGPFVRVRLEEL